MALSLLWAGGCTAYADVVLLAARKCGAQGAPPAHACVGPGYCSPVYPPPCRAAAGAYFCQQCLRAKAASEVSSDCGATLIVCPASILHQWQTEIKKHIREGALKVVVYEGQQQGLPSQQLGGRSLAAAAEGSDTDEGVAKRKRRRSQKPRKPKQVGRNDSMQAPPGSAQPGRHADRSLAGLEM